MTTVCSSNVDTLLAGGTMARTTPEQRLANYERRYRELAAQLADISPDLVRRPCVATDELELRMRDEGADGALVDIPGCPLHYSQCHQRDCLPLAALLNRC